MTTKDEALKMALNALEFSKSYLDDLADVHGTSKKAKPGSTSWHVDRAITACRAALAQKDETEGGRGTGMTEDEFIRTMRGGYDLWVRKRNPRKGQHMRLNPATPERILCIIVILLLVIILAGCM